MVDLTDKRKTICLNNNVPQQSHTSDVILVWHNHDLLQIDWPWHHMHTCMHMWHHEHLPIVNLELAVSQGDPSTQHPITTSFPRLTVRHVTSSQTVTPTMTTTTLTVMTTLLCDRDVLWKHARRYIQLNVHVHQPYIFDVGTVTV